MKNPMTKQILPLLMMSELLGDGRILGVDRNGFSGKERDEKKCLVCGKYHFHNNFFCSPECCKAYKKRKVSPVQPTTAPACNLKE